MKLRFQADNDLDQRIVLATRRLEKEIDFQTANQLGLHGLPDDQVLILSARERRVLVSHDRRTLPDHLARFIAHNDSPGIVIISQRLSISRAAELLHIAWAASEAEEYRNIVYELS